MTRPYEIPFYPVPPVLGILLNLSLTGVLIWYLVRTDPLALALTAGWIGIGVVGYIVAGSRGESEAQSTTDADAEPAAED